MNTYPDLMTEAAVRYRIDSISRDWAPVRRRRMRRRRDRLQEPARATRDLA